MQLFLLNRNNGLTVRYKTKKFIKLNQAKKFIKLNQADSSLYKSTIYKAKSSRQQFLYNSVNNDLQNLH